MIEYLNGKIASIDPVTATIDIGGIGYSVNISLFTYESLVDKKTALLYIHEVIREDSHTLYGFLTKEERKLFLLLISISGIGPSIGRIILSTMNPTELVSAIQTENTALIKSIKGIGPKTAQRIIIELKDKIKDFATSNEGGSKSAINNDLFEEATAALLMLGFPKTETQKVITKIMSSDSKQSIEQIIKQALKMF